MNKVFKIFSIISFVILLFIIGCQQKGKNDNYRIGAILPLTGPSSTLGELHKFGIDLAVEEINKKGGINGRKIEVLFEDSKNDSKTGIAAFNKLLNENVPAIISTFSNVSVPLASYMGTKETQDLPVLLATATSAPNITKLSPKVFRAFIISTDESKAIAEFLIKKNFKKVAIYYIEDDYGKGAQEVFKNIYENKAQNRNIVFSEAYRIGQTDHRAAITKLKSTRPEIIFVVGYDRDFALAVRQIKENNIRAEIITTAPLSIPQNLEIVGNSEGIYLTASAYLTESTKELSQQFDEAFKMKYNKPSNYQSASTYLCLKLIAESIKSKGYSTKDIEEGLYMIKEFPSPLGKISINQDREGSFQIVIKHIENGKLSDVKN